MQQNSVKVTLKMIAEAAGTSIGTVDRAISNRPGINAETKERVLHIARELGYTTNRFASALHNTKTIRIGIVYPFEPKSFFEAIDQGVDQAVKEFTQYGVIIEKLRFERNNPELQAAVLDRIDPSQYDGLAINSSGRGIAQHIDRLVRANLPVITFNTDAPDSTRLFFVGNDSLQSGRMGAELLARYIGGSGAVTVMGNFIQSMPFADRFGGFCEVINKEYPDITIYPCAECLNETLVAEKNLLAALVQVPSMRGVFCTSHSSTMGAIAAFKLLNRKDIVLIGFDVGGDSLDALETGWCDALLFQDPAKQAYQAVNRLSQHILEGWLPETPLIHVDTHVVIKHNSASYRSGNRPHEAFA